MKIFGICLVKNEADIIEYSLEYKSRWADKIFVYDNGSEDDTWSIVLKLAKKNSSIVPFKSEAKPFRDGLRAEVYNAYKHLASSGDWWCVRCDPDEFYIDNPKKFLTKVKSFYQVVKSLHYEYELDEVAVGEINFLESIDKILAQIKHYNKKCTSEIRFIRHRDRLEWNEQMGYPRRMGVIAPDRIRLKHFQYRSPQQIQTRITTRKQARKEGHPFFKKDNVENWKAVIKNRAQLIRETPEMPVGFIQDKNAISPLLYTYRFLMHNLKIYP